MGIFANLLSKKMNRQVETYQQELVQTHYQEVENMYRQMRGWRHDYHNHIQTLLALSGNEAKTREYLLKLNDDLTQVDTVLKTGNVMVDAILNSKLSLIRSKEIRVNAKAVVPTELNVSEIDLCSPPKSCCRFEPIGAKYHTVRAGNPHYDSAIW